MGEVRTAVFLSRRAGESPKCQEKSLIFKTCHPSWNELRLGRRGQLTCGELQAEPSFQGLGGDRPWEVCVLGLQEAGVGWPRAAKNQEETLVPTHHCPTFKTLLPGQCPKRSNGLCSRAKREKRRGREGGQLDLGKGKTLESSSPLSFANATLDFFSARG